jgi:23S rRNA (uracil1939-C5)-methyltransferase
MSRRDKRPRIIDVEIDAIDTDGLAVARAPNADVRVKGMTVGESAQVQVLSKRGSIRLAAPLQWHRASPRRVAPPCRSFMACGGCSLQQVDAQTQLALKERWLFDELAAVGIEPRVCTPPVTGPQLLYRRKARLSGRYLADNDEFLLGFHESFSPKVARMRECMVLAEPFSSGFATLRSALGGLSIAHLIPQVEISVGDDCAALVIRHLDALSEADLGRLRELEAELGADVLLQSEAAPIVTALDGTPASTLTYRLDSFGVSLEFGALDFVQVNAVVNDRLVAAAVAALDPQPGEQALDLFCGIGNFTLPIARRGARVYAVEANDAAVVRARANAIRNALAERIDVHAMDLYETPLVDGVGATKVLADPPRSGLGRSQRTFADPQIERVVYVSCEPRTFAFDAVELARHGFELTQCGVFDMFPHTGHVETLGVFERS